MSDKNYILAINPGSTSTKIAIYEDDNRIYEKSFSYGAEKLKPYPTINSQMDFRLEEILDYLKEIEFPLEKLSAVVGRGGIVVPVKSGAYIVNDLMIDRLKNRPLGSHASNLGGMISYEIAKMAGVSAFVYDGVTVDELTDVARITGLGVIERISRCHALNMRAVAIKAAQKMGKKYSEVNIIVTHMGGGITMSIHNQGRMADVVLDSEGPLSPERSGRLPATTLLKYMSRHNVDADSALNYTRGLGGMVSLLGTNSGIEVAKRMEEGDQKAKLVFDALIYQAAKSIGELATTVYGKVDIIALTGALAYNDYITSNIAKRVEFIAPVEVYPGENELESLAFGTLRVLRGEEKAHVYDIETDTLTKEIF